MPLPGSLARFNRTVTNHFMRLGAGHVPGFGIVTHQGRRSGRRYRTPVNVYRRPGGFALALVYGRGDWVRNVLAAGRAEILTRGRTHAVVNPRIVEDRDHPDLPAPVRQILRRIDVREVLLVDEEPTGA
jgi:deazaflavin-dependent oxidoreductase (nitroreductase family)